MIKLFPMPKHYEERDGRFSFAGDMILTLGKNAAYDAFAQIAPELFSNFCSEKAVLSVVRVDREEKVAFVSYKAVSDRSCRATDEDYELTVDEMGASLLFSDVCGLSHAFSTLLQLISAYDRKNGLLHISYCHIADSPAMAFRGMHLAVFPETPYALIRKMVRLCGLLKYSHIALEFFGTYRFDCFPYLGWKGDGSLTREQLAAIVREGRGMGVEFIPFLNHFGHAAFSRYRSGKHVVLDQAPEYEELFEPCGWTWDIENPETLSLLSSLRHELCEIFGKGSYFHIGCDEAFVEDGSDDGFETHDNDRFTAHVNTLTKELLAMGRTPIMWGDMLLPKDEFPYPYCRNVSFRCLDAERNLGNLNRDIIVDDWQYNIDGDKDETVKYFLDRGIEPSRLILSPWKKPSNIRGRCDIVKKLGLGGVLGTVWHSLRTDYGVIPYTACHAWSEDASYTERFTMDRLKSNTMQNLRKLLPCHGCYEEAGVLEGQVPFVIPNDN